MRASFLPKGLFPGTSNIYLQFASSQFTSFGWYKAESSWNLLVEMHLNTLDDVEEFLEPTKTAQTTHKDCLHNLLQSKRCINLKSKLLEDTLNQFLTFQFKRSRCQLAIFTHQALYDLIC